MAEEPLTLEAVTQRATSAIGTLPPGTNLWGIKMRPDTGFIGLVRFFLVCQVILYFVHSC